MRFGVIDLGTNSIRFDVRQLYSDGRSRQLYREKRMVRLGQNAFDRGRLDPEAVRRTLSAFLKFKRLSHDLRLRKTVAFGTATLREVEDRESFIDLIRRRTGVVIKVISGREEAGLIALGILANERLPKKTFALVDIGGGSTEISICRGRRVLHAYSFPLGVAKLQQRFLKTNPPTAEDVVALRRFLRRELMAKVRREKWPKAEWVIGSSGTLRALARIQKKRFGTRVLRPHLLQAISSELVGMSLQSLRGVPGLEVRRADMIVAGSILFEEIMFALRAKRAKTTRYSLRDGIVESETRSRKRAGYPAPGDSISSLRPFAERFGIERGYFGRTVELAETLYQGLAPVHRLHNRWRNSVIAAICLRNIGESVNLATHSVHSQYLIRNAELPFLEPWEKELIGLLCRYHEQGRPTEMGAVLLPGGITVPAFLKLLGLVRLADALDGGPDARIKIQGIKTLAGVVSVEYSGGGLTGLESLHIKQNGRFFKSVFRKEIHGIKVSMGRVVSTESSLSLR